MTVQELIDILSKADPNRRVVINAAYRGYVEVEVVLANEVNGLHERFSFEPTPVVELLSGDGAYMKSQGFKVVGHHLRIPLAHLPGTEP